MKVFRLKKGSRRFVEVHDLGELRPFRNHSLLKQIRAVGPATFESSSNYLVLSKAEEKRIQVLGDQIYGDLHSSGNPRIGSTELLLKRTLNGTGLQVTLFPANGDASRHYGDKGEWRTAICRSTIQMLL